MPNKRDYYEILGVGTNVSPDEIKRQFRHLARKYHPDVNKEAGAEAKFKEINEAYQVLSDPQKRAQYDQFGHTQAQPPPGGGYEGGFGDLGDIFGQGFSGFGGASSFGDLGDLFEGIFGGGRGSRRQKPGVEKGDDLRYDYTIAMEEAAKGTEKEVEYSRTATCPRCKGNRAEPGTQPVKCATCGGSGQVKRIQRTPLGNFAQVVPCAACRGTGETISNPCTQCRGAGRVRQMSRVSVKIPPGVENGTRLRLNGEGEAGVGGGPSGDLYVFLSVREHAKFKREGADLYYEAKIPFTVAALGGEVEVPIIDGSANTLKIEAGIQPGQVLALKGKGMPVLQSKRRGDLYIIINIEVPKHLSREQKEILKKFDQFKE